MISLARLPAAATQAHTDVVDDCSLSAPVAILKSDAYADYAFVLGPYHTAVERAALSAGVKVDISSSSCRDNVYQRLELTVLRPLRKYGPAHWLRVARSTLSRLEVNKDGTANVRDMQKFIVHVRAVQLRRGQFSHCLDGSVSDEHVCAWASGGGHTFEINETPDAIKIAISHAVSH